MSNLEKSLVEHLDEPAIYLSLYGHLCSFDIQNKEARSDLSSLVSIPNKDGTEEGIFQLIKQRNLRLEILFPDSLQATINVFLYA